MPAASAVTPFKSWQYMKEMCEAEYEPLQRQRMRRMAQLRELLVHAYREVDVYRQAMDRVGLDPVEVSYPRTFAQVPITSKNDLRVGFPDRQLARSYRGGWLRYSNTSGTTGRPLLLIQDIRDISFKYASILRSRALASVDPLGDVVRITPNECQPCLPGGRSPERVWTPEVRAQGPGRRAAVFLFLERQLVNPLFHRRHVLAPFWAGPDDMGPVDLDRYLDLIRKLRPEILTIYPLYALLLARHIRQRGLTPPEVRGVIDFSGGICTPEMRQMISETFGVRTAQGVGGREFARYGASCGEDPDRMHLAETYCYVETVRPDGELCGSGELGNVVVTSLHSWAMPIIRLEPGDVARVVEDPCTCGRRSRRIEHHGRIQALIRNADGRWVTARDVWDQLLFVRGVRLFQLLQRSERQYVLRIVPEPDVPLDDGALGAALEGLLGSRASVQRETVDGIRPERSGKLQLVKSCTFEDFRVVTSKSNPVPVN